ncbi:hypothetical protein ACH5RR_019008 [Cinchona calisaya]|uniref:XS domain-containing protein n=1 Tax=Cinchona calisaya TaxID=153742 RepID=A0ABD2ZN33_9GENT
MQSRREENHGTRSSTEARLRDPRMEMGSNPYLMPSREGMDRSPRLRRSLSPPGRVVGGRERRVGLFEEEGRDFDWKVGGRDVRGERGHFRSRSPPVGRMDERRCDYDEGFPSRNELRRKYEFCDVVDYKVDIGPDLGYKSFRGNVDQDRVFGDASDQVLSGKPRVLERGSMYSGEHRSQAEQEYTLRHAEDAGKSSLSSRNMENARFNNESIGYPDPFLLDKLVALETYRKGEEYTTQYRDVSYSKGSASLFRDTSQLKEFAGTFSRHSRENMMGCYEDDMSLPREVHPSGSAQPVEQYSFAETHQRHSLGTRRGSEADHKDLLHYKRTAHGPSVVEGQEQDYLYPRNGSVEKNYYGYPSEEFRGRKRCHDDLGYYQRDIITSNVMEPNGQHITHADYSQRHLRSIDSWDNPSSQDQLASKYLFPNRSLAAVDDQVRLRMDPESANVGFDDRVLGEAEVSLLNISPNDGFPRRRTTRGSERDAFFVSGTESMRISSDNQYHLEMQEHDLRRKAAYSDELDTYDPPKRSLKRKYDIDEELCRHRTRDTLSGNTYNLNSSKYHNERDDEWNHHDIDLLPSKSLEYKQNKYRKAGREVDFVQHGGDMISDDRRMYRDPVDYKQEYSSKPFKPGKRILKGQSRHGFLDSHDSQTFNKRRSLTQNVWLRGKDSKELDKPAYGTQESKNWVSSSESGPPEESKEFMEQVQSFFLSFSKMLNESLGTRKRYKEQGRAGSLFCIVCGKSLSKEFKDTQGLARHCFMSKKVGLRAQHLGLHKAICVLLGWNTAVGADVITFAPQVISSSEALAQKEDLILWPPAVIIHSISMSDSRPGGQKVFTKEIAQDFLKGKGFNVGKIKVCLGTSANNIMVVKFLGTFPGLQDAEKLHKYFLDDKHGRIDFEQMSLIKGKDSNTRKERTQAGKLEEHVLYGYMAISEDLDKVDYDTKRKCFVKSKKEIEYIAEEPLKFS